MMNVKTDEPLLWPFIQRLLLLLVISATAMLLISEIAFRLGGREGRSRAPQVVELVIPAGTADLIAAGEAAPSIPTEMTFVLGDTLLVRNEDSANHEVGPLWIPAGKSASMVLDQANDFAYTCSFQPTRYMGLSVKKAITWRDRLNAVWYGAPTTTMLLLVYSMIVRPLKPRPSTTRPGGAA